jgi:16S rRNA (adenine1518-N6/adenine1519-N6)-dimethyltransferase
VKKHGFAQGIALKKSYGQHFLRNDAIAQKIVLSVNLNETSSVFEIGCGDGALTRVILQNKLARLWVFEIDPEWAAFVEKRLPDPRLQIFIQDILTIDFTQFEAYKPWTLLANLPYQITFPILYKLHENRHLLSEGVIMIQEEVAKKLVAVRGRGYGFVSLFFQHYFDLRLLDKIAPSAFYPPPKVFSRLIYFKPRSSLVEIFDEVHFWEFVKACFKQPRRTLKNNLSQSNYDIHKLSESTLTLRAQQMNIEDLLKVWATIHP